MGKLTFKKIELKEECDVRFHKRIRDKVYHKNDNSDHAESSLEQKSTPHKEENEDTFLHIAARKGTLDAIPEHLFTEEALNEKDQFGHTAAKNDTLKHIPEHLFTEKALSKKNNFGETPWECIAKNKTISQIPKHLINKDFMKNNPELNRV